MNDDLGLIKGRHRYIVRAEMRIIKGSEFIERKAYTCDLEL